MEISSIVKPVFLGYALNMKIPQEITAILEKLEASGHEAWLVGGCVRDLMLERKIEDWDIATSAKPEEIMAVFPDSKYENEFGTVLVKLDEAVREKTGIKVVEITTFRQEARYSDKRHPDQVEFTDKLEDDLARRDFTINALALNHKATTKKSKLGYELVDLFYGQRDLDDKIIRAVGEPEKRFGEDALRMMRAVRFAAQLGFEIESKTKEAIKKNAPWLEKISQERIRVELEKIILSDNAEQGIRDLQEMGLLGFIMPELEKGIGVAQNRHHVYEVFEHNVRSLGFAVQKKFSLAVRLAALLHDIGKVQTKQGSGLEATFYNHEYVSAKQAENILERLRFSREMTKKITHLVRYHMFVYDVGTVSEAGVRRLIKRLGPENLDEAFNLRVADRLGSGCPKAVPYKLRHLRYMMEKVAKDPISVKMLKVNGRDIMRSLGVAPGPKVGAILDVLLAEVIEDPKRNTKEYLERRVLKLDKENLAKLREMAKEVIEEKRGEEDKEIKQKHWVE